MRTEDFRVDKEQDTGNNRQMNETVDNLTDRPSHRPVFWQINKTNRQVHGQLNMYIDPTVDVQTDTKCQT